jgi:hypothetical protein
VFPIVGVDVELELFSLETDVELELFSLETDVELELFSLETDAELVVSSLDKLGSKEDVVPHATSVKARATEKITFLFIKSPS